MRIACAGGGPAGLYFAILMKLWQPESDVTVFERNATGVTHGWGVIWERRFLDRMAGLDAESAAEIERDSSRWRDQVINFRGVREVNGANKGTYAVSRQRFMDILAARARGLGVDIRYSCEIRDAGQLPDPDLIVAADGVNSLLRDGRQAGFGTSVRTGRNKYTWLGTSKAYESFSFFFEQTEAGWIWAHAYQHEPTASTFIVECTPATWAGLGFDNGPASMALDRLEEIFGQHLDGHRLTSRFTDGSEARWQNFRTVRNERWHDGRVALVGDSAHTAHFSVGLGTTLAIDDVIALAEQLRRAGRAATWNRRWRPISSSASPSSACTRSRPTAARPFSRTCRVTPACRQASSPRSCTPGAPRCCPTYRPASSASSTAPASASRPWTPCAPSSAAYRIPPLA